MNFLNQHAEKQLVFIHSTIRIKKLNLYWNIRDIFSGKGFTCNITSTSYWLPFDFWCPLNFEPLYNKDLETPGCFDFAGGGGGGTTSMGGQVTRTGIVPRTSKYHSIKTVSRIYNASKTILIKLEYSPALKYFLNSLKLSYNHRAYSIQIPFVSQQT